MSLYVKQLIHELKKIENQYLEVEIRIFGDIHVPYEIE